MEKLAGQFVERVSAVAKRAGSGYTVLDRVAGEIHVKLPKEHAEKLHSYVNEQKFLEHLKITLVGPEKGAGFYLVQFKPRTETGEKLLVEAARALVAKKG